MRMTRFSWAGYLALLLLLATIPAVRAEVVSGPNYIILMGITEGPDPIPQVQWTPVLQPPTAAVLNQDGWLRDDGRPDIAVDPMTQTPAVVWAQDQGTDHDIAFNEFLDQAWRLEPELLADTFVDELDPRIFIDTDSTVWVTWWEDGPSSRILVRSRPLGSESWNEPILVTASGRRPSVAVKDGRLLVAYERDISTGGQDIVVASAKQEGGFVYDVVATTARTEPLDVILHSLHGRLWMEWKHDFSMFAYSELVGDAWVAPTSRPWVDRSWLGQEMVRKLIQLELTAP